ncbi:MAG: hypothetical protein IE909_07700 [Campylobacterales bacterium]|nr:hypothetical protein [Campylobacterales bacterium]
MSMSQEEIEALMSGAGDFDFGDEASQDDSDASGQEDSIDDILAGIDGIVDDGGSDGSQENFDHILAGIEGVVDTPAKESKPEKTSSGSSTMNIEELIDHSQYPMPVKQENKVVNQLNQVADDSEQKASQIFDVLSFILDENNEISNYNKEMSEFIKTQEELLTALNQKFPNIDVFANNLEKAKKMSESNSKLASKIDGENMKIFEAMELMQFHDINRQKIERVMAVIRKLNDYLNGIFEDNSNKPEVQIAKHISGDSNETVDSDDLEALISQYTQEQK